MTSDTFHKILVADDGSPEGERAAAVAVKLAAKVKAEVILLGVVRSPNIQAEGEDAQGFRAIAERSSLADFSKDGGSAAIFPALAEKWMAEHTADTGLSRMSDAERARSMAPFHVHWLILQQPAATKLVCPYANERVKVCQLP